MRLRTSRTGTDGGRATAPVVGVVLLVAVAVLLAATVAGTVFATARPEAAPQARIAGESVSASDRWPEGQTVRLTHESGTPLAVSALAVVVTVPRTGKQARLSGFPTRRLTDDNVDGAHVFDRTYAGVDGALDAVSTDGTWASGEPASLRVAAGDLDLRPGDAVVVRVVHEPTGTVIARVRMAVR